MSDYKTNLQELARTSDCIGLVFPKLRKCTENVPVYHQSKLDTCCAFHKLRNCWRLQVFEMCGSQQIHQLDKLFDANLVTFCNKLVHKQNECYKTSWNPLLFILGFFAVAVVGVGVSGLIYNRCFKFWRINRRHGLSFANGKCYEKQFKMFLTIRLIVSANI